jgi:tetratricopeptide (TPR) repeat protein
VPADAATRRGGQTGFRSAGTTVNGARRAGYGRAPSSSQVATPSYRRYGYYPRPYSSYPNCYGYGYGSCGPYYCSPYYSGGFYLGFTFGCGAYFGLGYYYPWYHCGSNWAFFYNAPISYCYVPYGFYCDAPATYVTRYVYVTDTYPTTDYDQVEAAPPAEQPAEGQKVVEPEPAAGSPVAEKYLRDASDLFRKADYLEAARLFRLAALSEPDNAAPLFALGQSLTALGSDAYAAKVLRKAVLMNPGLVKEPGDIVGVFKDQEEFEHVMADLQKRAEATPEGSDERFLLAAERYFSGDPKAVEGFAALKTSLPEDKAVELFDASAAKRFAAAGEELPPIAPK